LLTDDLSLELGACGRRVIKQMDLYQFDRTIRSSALTDLAANTQSRLGTFDPLNLWLHLDVDGRFDLEQLSKNLTENSSYFHEMVHCWQLYATSSGVITASICPIEGVMVPEFLRGRKGKIVKPLLSEEHQITISEDSTHCARKVVTSGMSEDDFVTFMLHKYYFDFEKFNSALDDPAKVLRTHKCYSGYAPRVRAWSAISRFPRFRNGSASPDGNVLSGDRVAARTLQVAWCDRRYAPIGVRREPDVSQR
jgi:hypothetical protein